MKDVIVVGASPNQNRYSWRAMKMLLDNGYKAYPVSVKTEPILGIKPVASLDKVDLNGRQPYAITMYVSSANQTGMLPQIIKLSPRRVIFNPGTENPQNYSELTAAGIEVIEACTLVMLSSDQF